MPNFFLAKTDPETYSIADFTSEKITPWTGVRSYQAVNVIKTWKVGDAVLIYHSLGEASIVGLAKVIDEPRPDLNDERKISWFANLELVRVYDKESRVNLKQIKTTELFTDFALVRQSRLSTMACPDKFINWLSQQGLDLSI
jgi:predicted RNA-binding protein with PUA-like domain